jgi:hypothetical protein
MSFDIKIENGDLKIGNNGDLQKVENTDKLIQDVLKMCLTQLGGNPFFPFYGSPVSSTLIGNTFDFEMLNTVATSQLRGSLENLQQLQKLQEQNGQRLTASELLAAIQQVAIERNATDPRYYRVLIKILTKAMTSVTTSFDVSNGL